MLRYVYTDAYRYQSEERRARHLDWQGRVDRYFQSNSFNRIRRDLCWLVTIIVTLYLIFFGYLIYRENVENHGGRGKNNMYFQAGSRNGKRNVTL